MIAALRKEIVIDKTVLNISAISLFTAFTALGAFVRIPLAFTPVPLTLQTFFVLLSGALLGRFRGSLSQLFYILLGLAGVPVFSGYGAGALYFCGPTAGYIFGFLPAAMLSATIFSAKEQNWLGVFIRLSLADACLLLTGTIWLKLLMGLSFQEAFWLGFLPFIAGDMCKVALAATAYKKLHGRFKSALG